MGIEELPFGPRPADANHHHGDDEGGGGERVAIPDAPRSIPRAVCPACGESSSIHKRLRHCSRCYTVAYCNPTCQKSHWRTHKPDCNPRVPLTMHNLAVTLAGLQDLARSMNWYRHNPAIFYRWANVRSTTTDETSGVTAVSLAGDRMSQPPDPAQLVKARKGSPQWMAEFKRAVRLQKRMMMDDSHEVAMACATICAVHELATAYRTKHFTSPGANAGAASAADVEPVPVELFWRSNSRIIDYGVALGEFKADDLLYYNYSACSGDGPTRPGNHQRHAWIYFSTDVGDEIIVDYTAFRFGFGLGFDTRGYLPPSLAQSLGIPNVPTTKVGDMQGLFAYMGVFEWNKHERDASKMGQLFDMNFMFPVEKLIKKKSLAQIGHCEVTLLLRQLVRELLAATEGKSLKESTVKAETELAATMMDFVGFNLVDVIENTCRNKLFPKEPRTAVSDVV